MATSPEIQQQRRAYILQKRSSAVRNTFLHLGKPSAVQVMDQWEAALRKNCESIGIDRDSDDFVLAWIIISDCARGLAKALADSEEEDAIAGSTWVREMTMRLEAIGLWSRATSLEMPPPEEKNNPLQ